MTLNSSQTYQNLVNAFAGESQARVRYQFLVYAAKQQQLFEVSKALSIVERNEFNHARMFYTAIQSGDNNIITNLNVTGGYPFKEKWDFVQNLQFAMENEKEESDTIYPGFAQIAQSEGFPDIEKLFNQVAAVEDCHKKFFAELHTQLVNGTMYKRDTPIKWKCCECGHEETLLEAWQVCPLCKASQGHVMLHMADQ